MSSLRVLYTGKSEIRILNLCHEKSISGGYLQTVALKLKLLLVLNVFTSFLILDKIQDGNHVWLRHRPLVAPLPINYTSSCRSKAFY